MTESDVLKQIRLFVSSKFPNTILFRNNTAVGWAGRVIKRTANTITIQNPNPIRAGLCVGSSDLIGLTTVKITQSMVGKRIAVFTGVEVKKEKGVTTKEQKKFIEFIKSKGGLAGVARNESDVEKIIPNQKLQ